MFILQTYFVSLFSTNEYQHFEVILSEFNIKMNSLSIKDRALIIKMIIQKAEQRKKLKIVLVSDTHGNLKQLKKAMAIKGGDIFIHAGDFTEYGVEQDFKAFFHILDQMQFKYKIVIAGNHEIILDNGCMVPIQKEVYLNRYKCSMTKQQIVGQIQKRAIYLEHQMVEIQGIKIFGSPYSPYYVGNAFQYAAKYEKVIWDAIPHGIDLLVTHSPPFDILDKNGQKKSSGSKYLREIIFKRRPRYHVFGHIHESKGMQKIQGITFLNVANEATMIML